MAKGLGPLGGTPLKGCHPACQTIITWVPKSYESLRQREASYLQALLIPSLSPELVLLPAPLVARYAYLGLHIKGVQMYYVNPCRPVRACVPVLLNFMSIANTFRKQP